MTATIVTPRTYSGRYGLPQLLRSEWAKITTLRSTLWTLAISVVGMLLVTGLSTNSVRLSPGAYQGFDPTNQSLSGVLIGVLTMGVFGVLVVTGEYSSGTMRTSLAATPRRGVFVAGKVIVAGLAMLCFSEVMSFACWFLGQAVLHGNGMPSAHLGQPGVIRAIVMSGAFLAFLGVLGMALGLIVRHTAGGISAYVALTFLIQLLMHPISEHLARYLPLQMLANSVTDTVTIPNEVSPTLGLVLMGVYAAVVLGIGVFMFRTRDA